MKRFVLLIAAMVCLNAPAFAEGLPSVDVFGGFSINHLRYNPGRITLVGWQANASWNLYKSVGLVSDFAGEYKRDEDGQLQFLFGPRVHRRTSNLTVFGEALFGGDRISGGNYFAMAYGGGVEVPAGKVNIRVIQFDWIPIRLGNGNPWLKNNTRFGFGVNVPIRGE